ncbi:MAG: Lrp/AsnC family transcriptional regulator [Nanoarchaeota archaeon]|nr:Lrp/AsnC family transcriptional regulator [Nanoarchaeota archaeon]
MVNIDLIDRKILYELDKDARVSLIDIAKKIRKSKQFVEYRIRKLTDSKVILGYNTMIDMTALGYKAFRINLRLKSITDEQRKAMIKQMIADPEVWWYGHAEGSWSVCYAMAVKDGHDFNRYWEKVLNRHGHMFKDYLIIYYIDLTWYPSKFLVNDRNNDIQFSMLSRKETDIDETDKRILNAIKNNARFNYLELEHELKLSRATIQKRILRLQKEGVIVGYKLWFNEKMLGYRFYKTYLKFNRWNEYTRLYEYCKRNPYMITVNKTIGGADFEIELKVKDLQHFEEIIEELLTTFPGLVESYEFVAFKTEDKMSFLPDDF